MMVSVICVLLLLLTIYSIPCETLKCYECTGHVPCGQRQADLIVDCRGKCMVYRNQYDGGTIVRRCCSNDCGATDGLRTYEGRHPAYFCSDDMCNGALSDSKLSEIIIESLTTSGWLTTNAASSSVSCYDCTSHNSQCGNDQSTLVHGCQACIIYRNAYDGNTIIRRCCTFSCRSSGIIGDYEGRTAYFCSSNRCNEMGIETILTDGISSSRTTARTTTLSSTQTATISVSSSVQCYDCSGIDCGREGSPISMSCPTCMVYRNPDDQTRIERRCCWWACGSSNSVSTYNGLQTYFCSSNKCNGYGSDNILNPAVTTTIRTTSLTTTSTTTYSSLPSCTLNCQNDGIPETEDGCFCYCTKTTNGRECENIDCPASDTDTDICTVDNRSLCDQSEIFAYTCLHLCGKC